VPGEYEKDPQWRPIDKEKDLFEPFDDPSSFAHSNEWEINANGLVFKGAEVPVQLLIDHKQAGKSLESFLESYPAVRREQAERLWRDLSPRANRKPAKYWLRNSEGGNLRS